MSLIHGRLGSRGCGRIFTVVRVLPRDGGGAKDATSVHTAFKLAGLDDPEVFEAVRFRDKEDVLLQLFPGLVCTLTAEADDSLAKLLQGTAARALLARRHLCERWS